ncbi:MAG: hypothetical protein ACHP84_03085 [Caulobacterales bacterium]
MAWMDWKLRGALTAAAAACAMTLAAGAAAAPAPVRAPAVQAVVDCKQLADGAARLACYDSAVDKLTQAEASGDLVTIDREQRRTVRRQAFGLILPSFSLFDRGERPEEINQVSDSIASVGHSADGKWVFRLESGAVWRAIEDADFYKDPKPGDPVVIKRRSLGSFMMEIDRMPGFKAHRDN